MLACHTVLMFMGNMILNCPNCAARYVVPDTAISVNGRRVRCANCKHSWFQEAAPINVDDVKTPPITVAPKSAKITAPKTAPKDDIIDSQNNIDASDIAPTKQAQDTIADVQDKQSEGLENNFATKSDQQNHAFDKNDVSGNVNEPANNEEPNKSDTSPSLFKKMADHSKTGQEQVNEYAQALAPIPPAPFDPEPPFKARRNPAKLWTIAAIAFAFIIMIIAGALWYSGALEGSLSREVVTSELELVLNDNHEINETQDGRRFVIASGTIINPTQQKLAVPDMLAILLDDDGRELYIWEIPAPVETLGPGAKVEFSGAARDNVPRAASDIAIDWKGAR